MAIENRDLPAGTRLVATYKKQAFVCTVEAGDDGKLAFVLEDGKRYKSPSSAGSAVMGGSACNGWRWWSIEGAAPAATTTPTRARTKANSGPKPAKAGRKPKAPDKAPHRIIRPSDHQEDVPEGQVRYWCDGCMESFLGFAGQEPEQCPNGHRVDDPELNAAPTAEEALTG